MITESHKRGRRPTGITRAYATFTLDKKTVQLLHARIPKQARSKFIDLLIIQALAKPPIPIPIIKEVN
jgi:hypothetical protein